MKVVVDAGVCPESLRGFPNLHPQGIGRSLLLRLDPSGPRIHWSRVYREPLHGKMVSNLGVKTLLSRKQINPTALIHSVSLKCFMSGKWFGFFKRFAQLHSPCKPANMAHPAARISICACPRDLNLWTHPSGLRGTSSPPQADGKTGN